MGGLWCVVVKEEMKYKHACSSGECKLLYVVIQRRRGFLFGPGVP